MAEKRNSFALLASNSQESVRFWAQHPPDFNYVFPFFPQLVSLWNVGHHGSIQVDSTPPPSVFLFIIKKKKKRSLGWPGVLPSPWQHLTVSALPPSLISTQPVAVGTFTESGKATAMMALPGVLSYPISRVMTG